MVRSTRGPVPPYPECAMAVWVRKRPSGFTSSVNALSSLTKIICHRSSTQAGSEVFAVRLDSSTCSA